MKKLLLALATVCLCLVLPWTVWADQGKVSFNVCGKLQNATEEAAIVDAQKRAVKQALAREITPDNDPASVYQQMVTSYKSFVIGKPVVQRLQKIQNMQLAYCAVTVDMAKLKEALHEKIRSLQLKNENRDDEVFFFVRVHGPTLVNPKFTGVVADSYTDAFQKLGFNKGMSDEMSNTAMQRYAGLNLVAYDDAIAKEVKNNVEISIAVVGEITLLPSTTDGQGTNSTALVDVSVLKNMGNGNLTKLGEFKDQYVLRRTKQEEAELLVLQKAAYNSAQYLAKLTLDTWRK